ncbi:MAG: hypothetical protein Q8Q31_02760 [Nanoarchaeota archaeon]|nr:hypothetical protein [Nanoarchaeota archaeon]
MKREDARLKRIYRDIKDIKIQGATNIARVALQAYYLKPEAKTKNELIGLRPTEPMLVNTLNSLGKLPKEEIASHFDEAQDKINRNALNILKGKKKVYTHCHSTNVIKALVYAKKKGKNFEVYNTETRPLFQGRTTSKDLAKAGIKVTQFVDSGMHQAIKEVDLIMIGADALLKSSIINKIGSGAIAEIAYIHKKPLYIVADSWKFSPKNVRIEERDFHEVWKNAPKNVKVRDPAFEKIDKKYITGIISELGVLKYNDFLRKISRK